MKTLFVFDSNLSLNKIKPSLFAGDKKIILFPLTSQIGVLKLLAENLNQQGCEVKILETARIINDRVDILRDKYIQFIAGLPGRIKSNQRDLKGLFEIDARVSLWWFSIIAEKSTHKSDAFNLLVQLDSVVHVAKEERVKKIILGYQNKRLNKALQGYCKDNNLRYAIVPTKRIKGFRRNLKESQTLIYLKHFKMLLSYIATTFLRALAIKLIISSLRTKVHRNRSSLLLLTYYPIIDELFAKRGLFKNNHYKHFQESLENNKQDIAWLALYVRYSNIVFREALLYMRQFIKNGYNIFLLDEFNTFRNQLKAFFIIIISGFRFIFIEEKVRKEHTFGDYNFYLLFRDDWYTSFVGLTGYEGISFYFMFKEAFETIKAKKCIYPCEMQAWEKALICARDVSGINMSLSGYQPCTISKMLLSYFNWPTELSDTGRFSLPKPEKIICNGQIPYSYMLESGWQEDRLFIAEAIRYAHFKKAINLQPSFQKQNIALLAFSVNPYESSAILNVATEAFKEYRDVRIWIRPHPALQLKEVFALSNIPIAESAFEIDSGRLEDALSVAKVVVAGESSVSVEALAYGCKVVIVNIPEWICMSPLIKIQSNLIKSVDSSDFLREAIFDIFKEEFMPGKNIEEAREIINRFFYINYNSDIPEKFLEIINAYMV